MAKYFVTLVLLVFVALEITNVHNRMFAKSDVYKHPHHHLRHQKYASPETSDHNTYHHDHDINHPNVHREDHQQLDNFHDHDNNRPNVPREAEDHQQLHNFRLHHHQPQHEKYNVGDEQHIVGELAIQRPEEKETSEHWDLSNQRYKPNLWYILHTELSRSIPDDDDAVEDAADFRRNSDEADMLRDEKYDIQVDNGLDNNDGASRNNHNQQMSQPSVTIKCPKCESNRQNVRVSEEELTRLRIEFVKRQILEKLRLKDKPNVSAAGMPKPIYEETTIQHDETTSSKDLDDYYARASKKFIFLEREKHECHHLSQPSICFSFKIDDLDAEAIDVSKAVLWIFKKRNRKDLLKQTIVVSEVEQGGHNSKYLPKVKPIAIQSVDVQEGWMKIDIEWPIKRWFGIHDLSHLIHISCQSCEIDSADGLLSTEKDFRPFIMIDTQNRRRVSRQKRSVNCTNGVTECCREKLYISFGEIGWGDWIIRPRGYDAYFCRGSCSTAASIAQSTTHHSSLMRKVISHRDTTSKKPLELIPCCTANQYSSLEIFFRDSNNTATLMKFPNMVIESCGCM